MPIDEAGLSAALDAGIAEAAPAPAPTPTPAPAPDKETPDGPPNDGAEGETPPLADGEPVSGGSGPADAAKPAAAKDVSGDDAATDVGGDKADDGEPAVAADGAAVEKPPEKEPDPMNDPIPNALKPATKERIRTLISRVRDSEDTITRANRDIDSLIRPIEESRATPVQYQQALTYLTWVNSDNLEDKQKAIGFMLQELRALGAMTGVVVPGIDFLEGHDDLKAEVQSGAITVQRAQEIAVTRERDRRAQRIVGERQQAQNAQQAQAAEKQRGISDMVTLGNELRANDPHYAAKYATFREMLVSIRDSVHPSQWVATARRLYKTIPNPVAAPAPAPVVTIPKNQPLRGTNPAGGAVGEPKSALDALNAGLASMR